MTRSAVLTERVQSGSLSGGFAVSSLGVIVGPVCVRSLHRLALSVCTALLTAVASSSLSLTEMKESVTSSIQRTPDGYVWSKTLDVHSAVRPCTERSFRTTSSTVDRHPTTPTPVPRPSVANSPSRNNNNGCKYNRSVCCPCRW